MSGGTSLFMALGRWLKKHDPRCDRGAPTLIVLGWLLLVQAIPAHAQLSTVTVRGVVYSADSHQPLAAALITLDDGVTSVRSDLDGAFEFTGFAAGTHVIVFARAGYKSRAFRVAIADSLEGTLEIGAIELSPNEHPPVRITGVVINSRTSDPIGVVPIALNGLVVAVTDQDGGFQVDSVPVGNNLLEARRIGFVPLAADVEAGLETTELELRLTLEPLPFQLDDVEVVVEGDRTIYAMGRMRDFYRRRRSTPGEFITRDEIERRNPLEISDMLYGVPGVRISRSGFQRQITVRGCTPVVYLDGMPLRNVELDAIVFPEHVEAIEVHRGAFMPVEFMTFGACAAIVIWTR